MKVGIDDGRVVGWPLGVDELGLLELGWVLGIEELGTDELGLLELGTDELGTDELGTDELGTDEGAAEEVAIFQFEARRKILSRKKFIIISNSVSS